MLRRSMTRRAFARLSGLAACSAWLGCRDGAPERAGTTASVDDFLLEKMASLHIPGLAACALRGDAIVWSGEYGWADRDAEAPMTLDTVQNIASISKTVTATALMQLWETGAFRLQDDVNDYLSFELRHPNFPRSPITFEQLLTHVSGIADGTSYSRSYACGDPPVSLQSWIEEYFTPGGRFYDREENFHDWAPGERYAYNNVAFGLIAYLIERISGDAFADRCQTRIFEPLGMNETSWWLDDVDASRHAVPYTWVARGEARGPTWGGEAQGAIDAGGPTGAHIETDGFVSNCLYNHPNYPDGFLRTSVRQLASYASCYLRGGSPVLEGRSVDEMLRVRSEEIWGLSWYVRDIAGHAYWGHGGADPGVNTRIDIDPVRSVGAIVFANTFIDDAAAEMRGLNARILEQV